MAILDSAQLVELRQRCAEAIAPNPVTWTKPQINTACQAIEDWFEANRVALGAAIETAVPGAFTNAQKTKLVKYWLAQKAVRE
jgi:hypothetical protein